MPSAHRPLTDSAFSLAVAVAAILAFVPPFGDRLLGYGPWAVVIVAFVLATSLLLHWVFLGIAVQRLGRGLFGWLALAVVLMPVGGAAALILLKWFSDEAAIGAEPGPALDAP